MWCVVLRLPRSYIATCISALFSHFQWTMRNIAIYGKYASYRNVSWCNRVVMRIVLWSSSESPSLFVMEVVQQTALCWTAVAASWRDNQETFDFQNFVSVAAAECVGSRFIYRSAFLDSSAGYRHNSYAGSVLHKFGRRAADGYTVCESVCVRVWLCVKEVGCCFVEATFVPSVQEMKQGESENIVHPQQTNKQKELVHVQIRRESKIHVSECVCVFVCVWCRFGFTHSTMLYL